MSGNQISSEIHPLLAELNAAERDALSKAPEVTVLIQKNAKELRGEIRSALSTAPNQELEWKMKTDFQKRMRQLVNGSKRTRKEERAELLVQAGALQEVRSSGKNGGRRKYTANHFTPSPEDEETDA